MRGRRRPGYGVRLGSNPARRGRGAAGRAIAELELRQEGVPPTWRTAGPPPPPHPPLQRRGAQRGALPSPRAPNTLGGRSDPFPPPGRWFLSPQWAAPGCGAGLRRARGAPSAGPSRTGPSRTGPSRRPRASQQPSRWHALLPGPPLPQQTGALRPARTRPSLVQISRVAAKPKRLQYQNTWSNDLYNRACEERSAKPRNKLGSS